MKSYVAETGTTHVEVGGGPATAARAFWRLHVNGQGPTWPKGVKVSTQEPLRFWYFKFTTIKNDGTPMEVSRKVWLKHMGLMGSRRY